jgi:hypothetical protein
MSEGGCIFSPMPGTQRFRFIVALMILRRLKRSTPVHSPTLVARSVFRGSMRFADQDVGRRLASIRSHLTVIDCRIGMHLRTSDA